jgi:iron complex transport system substrate-binding protein
VHDLPERGRLAGRGDTLSLERLIADRPDLVMDFGTINATYRSLADRVTAQTGIPYVLIDGRFENTPQAIRLLGGVLGVRERAEELALDAERILAMVDRVVARVPPDQRPRVYLARGPAGLETGTRGSITTEIIERVGAVNVADGIREGGGLVNVSPEQVIAWAPDTIITLDRVFHREAKARPEWRAVPAIARDRVFLAPRLPYGFIDAPPSINRLIGLVWLIHTLYPEWAEGDLDAEITGFYRKFYGVDLDRPALAVLLGRD